ncbi:hypothetical protein AeRB84_020620 [Aphanomyces euteiches]|nr:hypothetical protein AeRB84_020620 [Aphanomyces euteiches]
MRQHLTLKQKISIVKMHDKNPNWTRNALMLWATREFKLDKPPSKSTITRILQAKSRLQDLDTDDVQAERKQIHPFTSSELETQLWSWFQDKENDGVALSGQLITMKAQSILETIGHGDQLKLSSG